MKKECWQVTSTSKRKSKVRREGYTPFWFVSCFRSDQDPIISRQLCITTAGNRKEDTFLLSDVSSQFNLIRLDIVIRLRVHVCKKKTASMQGVSLASYGNKLHNWKAKSMKHNTYMLLYHLHFPKGKVKQQHCLVWMRERGGGRWMLIILICFSFHLFQNSHSDLSSQAYRHTCFVPWAGSFIRAISW